MIFGFMNKKEKAFYDQHMYELLKDEMDANGRVPQNSWKIADRMTRNFMITLIQSGLL